MYKTCSFRFLVEIIQLKKNRYGMDEFENRCIYLQRNVHDRLYGFFKMTTVTYISLILTEKELNLNLELYVDIAVGLVASTSES